MSFNPLGAGCVRVFGPADGMTTVIQVPRVDGTGNMRETNRKNKHRLYSSLLTKCENLTKGRIIFEIIIIAECGCDIFINLFPLYHDDLLFDHQVLIQKRKC